jgi:hypothetical protein
MVTISVYFIKMGLIHVMQSNGPLHQVQFKVQSIPILARTGLNLSELNLKLPQYILGSCSKYLSLTIFDRM